MPLISSFASRLSPGSSRDNVGRERSCPLDRGRSLEPDCCMGGNDDNPVHHMPHLLILPYNRGRTAAETAKAEQDGIRDLAAQLLNDRKKGRATPSTQACARPEKENDHPQLHHERGLLQEPSSKQSFIPGLAST
jgi:hypothetical protein